MSGPSLHLSWSELACHDKLNSCYPLDWRTEPTRAVALARAFEDLRAECSNELGAECPLTVGEGFRTRAYQEWLLTIPRYKAAKHSQHCEGRAVDVYCPRFLTFDQFAACAARAASRAGSPIRYIEYRPSMRYIHIDVRLTSKLVQETVG